MAKSSITFNLTAEEINLERINVNKKDIGKFFPELQKEIKLIYGMTEISGKIESEKVTEKKKSKEKFYIKISQNLNFMTNDKIKLVRLSEDTFEIQKL